MFWTGRERSLRAWLQFAIGLFGYGASVALMLQSGLGVGPWDAFHTGLHNLTGMSVGQASILAGLLLVIGTWFVGVQPGLGTLANMLFIGLIIDGVQPFIPLATNRLWGVLYFVPAVLICGLSTGLYIGAGLGKGPRDGLMIAVSDRTGWPVRRARTAVELIVLFFGWLMGGQIGIGTLMFALGIGPAAQWGLRLWGALDEPAARKRPPADVRRTALKPEA